MPMDRDTALVLVRLGCNGVHHVLEEVEHGPLPLSKWRGEEVTWRCQRGARDVVAVGLPTPTTPSETTHVVFSDRTRMEQDGARMGESAAPSRTKHGFVP